MPDDVLDRMTPKDTVNRKDDITSLQHIIKKIMLEDFEIALNNASDNEVEKFVEGLQDNA
jgi:coenzyme F420-reducing hydrogenase delta subunit